MFPHLGEILRLGRVRGHPGRHRKSQGGTLGIGEQIGCLETPERLNLLVRNADLVKMIGTMRLAVPTATGEAGDREDQLLQLTRDLAFRKHELDHPVPCFPEFGPVAHLEFLSVLIGNVVHVGLLRLPCLRPAPLAAAHGLPRRFQVQRAFLSTSP